MTIDSRILFGKRLRQARIMRGLSLRELAGEMGGVVSHNALARYERGEMMPGSDILIAASRTLKQPLGFFARPMTREITDIEFRKNAERLTVTMQDAVKEKALDCMERTLEIEAILGLTAPFRNPLGHFKVAEPEDMERAAEALRTSWKLGEQPIAHVIDMLEGHGVKVCDAVFPPSCDGLSGWMGSTPVMVLAQHLNEQCATRKRLTALHELAHLLLKDVKALQKYEKFCYRFAGAMLIPRNVLELKLGGARQAVSQQELIGIKVEYGISIAAIMARAYELNLISKSLYHRYFEQNRQVVREPADGLYSNTEKPVQFERQVFHALAEEQISASKAADLLNEDVSAIREKMAVFS